MRVKFLKLIHDYEKDLESKLTEKKKADYIGEVGKMVDVYSTNQWSLYTIKFSDGQRWCLDSKEFEIINEKAH